MPTAQTLYRAPFLPSNDLGNITIETQMPNGRGSALILPLPSNGSLDKKPFRVHLIGRVTTNSNLNLSLALYFGTNPTVASNTQLFASGPCAVNNVSSNWEMAVNLMWDGTSLAMNGWGTGQVAGAFLTQAGLANTPTADPNRDSNPTLATGPTYGFTLTGFFSGSSAGNHAFVDIFDLELT